MLYILLPVAKVLLGLLCRIYISYYTVAREQGFVAGVDWKIQ
jgi:hypothetical protein